MGQTEGRLIIGFYGDNVKDARRAFDVIRQHSPNRAWLLNGAANGSRLPRTLARYRDTLLGDEHLVAGRVDLPDDKRAFDQLRLSEGHAVFILNEEVGECEPADEAAHEVDESSVTDFFATLPISHLSLGPIPKRYLPELVARAEATLVSSLADLRSSSLLGHAVTTTGEWLLDNSYLFEVNAAEVLANLPKRSGSNVPGLVTEGGKPRIFAIACALANHLNFSVDSNAVVAALQSYQEHSTLNVAELWLFPIALRLAILDGVAQISARAARAQDTREYAYFWTNRLVAAARVSPESLEKMLDALTKEPLIRSELFLNALAEQLYEEDIALARFHERIAELLPGSLTDVVRRQHQAETADRIAVANAVGSLRLLAQIDFTKIFVKVSRVEAILNEDPAGDYPRTDFATRNRCRNTVESIARRSGRSEVSVAERAISLAAAGADGLETYVEWYLIGPGIPVLEREVRAKLPIATRVTRWIHGHPAATYLTLIGFLTAFLAALFVTAAMGPSWQIDLLLIVLAAATLFPFSEFAIQVVNALVVSTLPPTTLPRMNFEDGIPDSCRTLVAIPMMLANLDVLKQELAKLETRFVGNSDARIDYALLADFTDAPEEHMPGDAELLSAAHAGIDELRKRHGNDRFFFFRRNRAWSESEQAWIGQERKRGKIEDLNAILCGGVAGMFQYPALEREIAFVISLDADTLLPAESARKMIETIAHPLNRVRLSPDGRRLSGYSIIQPRISIGLPGARITRFTRIFADARGTDPYCQAVSDLYQDLFRESIFHGKAIYDVKAMHAILHHRFPAATILSHDLIEGAFVGVAAASQIELFENLPTDYPAFSKRQHRWIRGDWQIRQWLRNKVPNGIGQVVPNTLSLVSRWQIFDNLRRSLVAPVSMLLLFLAWFLSPTAGISTFLITLAVAVPSLAPVIDRLARNASGQTHGTIGLAEELQRTIVYLSVLPHQGWLNADAIVRVFYRQWVSHRHLLEWQTAEAVNQSKQHVSRTMRECTTIAVGALVMMMILSVEHRLVPALPFLLLWAASPLVILWLGRPVQSAFPAALAEDDRDYLRVVARRIWRTFDDLVGPQTNWLPPDNTQLSLRVEVAQRTSPTNIGMWLTSLLAASDLGLVTPEDVLARYRASLHTVSNLERYEGHWLNWYSLTDLQPLEPRYVSTVDSGNLLACFWVVEQGLKELPQRQSPSRECLSGMASTLGTLEEVMGKDAAMSLPLDNLRRLLDVEATDYKAIDRLRQAKLPIQNLKKSLTWFADGQSEAAYWVNKLEQQCNAWLAHCDLLLGWMDTLAGAPDPLLHAIHPDLVEARLRAIQVLPSIESIAQGTVRELNEVLRFGTAAGGAHSSAWLTQLAAEYAKARVEASALLDGYTALAAEVGSLAMSIDMSFVYDRKRKLFGIGYEVGTPVEFSSHYDLLASECRLASLASIAKGDVPVEHWNALGRPYVSTESGQVLLSWSGTMFEYLMPVLFMKPFENSFLAEAARLAIEMQREYSASTGRPWGISEAAYSALDANQIYQYRAFGVPGLGLKPNLESDWVVSPYSTLLALQIHSHAALDNLRELAKLKLYGPMGFYESIDYTRPAEPEGPSGVIIYCYMAHHQGMALTALANTLQDGTMQRRFHQNPLIRSVEFLLYERVPTTRSLLRHLNQERSLPAAVAHDDWPDRNPRAIGPVPSVQLLGNGQYSVVVTNAGSGFSRWREFDIARWRADTTLDSHGTYFYVRDTRSGATWSPSPQPMRSQLTALSVAFSASQVRFSSTVHGIDQTYEICVAPDDNVEIRRFVFSNRGLRGHVLEITSYLELALAPHAAELAHPAFSKMFVQTEWLPERTALVARRRRRGPAETEIWAGHMLVSECNFLQVEFESSRETFLGRNRTVHNPEALERSLNSLTGTVIDPAFAIRCRFSLDARQRCSMAFLTMVAGTRDEVLALMERYAK